MDETTVLADLAADDYAKKCGISRRTLDRRIKEGKIVAKKINGKTFISAAANPEPTEQPKPVEKVSDGVIMPSDIRDTIFHLGIQTQKAKSAGRWCFSAVTMTGVSFLLAMGLLFAYMTIEQTKAAAGNAATMAAMTQEQMAERLTQSEQQAARLAADLAESRAQLERQREAFSRSASPDPNTP